MNPIDDLRGDYKRFLDSPAGKDLLTRLIGLETQYRAASAQLKATGEQKLTSIDKMNTIYEVRTLLDDLSKPKSMPLVRPGSTRQASK